MGHPTLATNRLILRELHLDDVPVIQRLAGRREIADTTATIPHPYSEQNARDWIALEAETFAQGKAVGFAIFLVSLQQMIGAIGLRDIDTGNSQAELGFWVGIDWWRQGIATEAGAAVVRYGFQDLHLNRIYAHHMVRNPASGRVLEKVGMKREGLLRQRIRKWGKFEDVVALAVLREDVA